MSDLGTRKPSVADALIAFAFAIVWSLSVGLYAKTHADPWLPPLFTIGLALVPGVYAAIFRLSPIQTFRLRSPRPKQLLGGIFLSFGLVLAIGAASVISSFIFPKLSSVGLGARINVADPDLLKLVFVVTILPAIAEEFLFRGFILSGLETGLRPPFPSLVCGGLFGLLHLSPAQIPFAAVVGIALSWVAVETDSLAVTIVMHALHNVALLIAVRAVISCRASASWVRVSPSPFALAVALIPLALISFALMRQGVNLVRRDARSLRESHPEEEAPR